MRVPEAQAAGALRQFNPMTRHVLVWSTDHSVFQHYGSYVNHADGKVLLYQAKAEYPGHDIDRVTDSTYQRLEATA